MNDALGLLGVIQIHYTCKFKVRSAWRTTYHGAKFLLAEYDNGRLFRVYRPTSTIHQSGNQIVTGLLFFRTYSGMKQFISIHNLPTEQYHAYSVQQITPNRYAISDFKIRYNRAERTAYLTLPVRNGYVKDTTLRIRAIVALTLQDHTTGKHHNVALRTILAKEHNYCAIRLDRSATDYYCRQYRVDKNPLLATGHITLTIERIRPSPILQETESFPHQTPLWSETAAKEFSSRQGLEASSVSFDFPGFPHYRVLKSTENTYWLRGIHFRYEPYKDRAKLWLPLQNETVPGTSFKRYDSVTLTIFDPMTNAHLKVTPHNICKSRSSTRGYIRLDWATTNYFKQAYSIEKTRLIDNADIEVRISLGDNIEPEGPSNQWKPEFLNQVYKLGLLEETAHALHYDNVISADIRFQGGGSTSRPDIIAIMGRTRNDVTEESLVIIEGKACHERKASYYLIEAIIQVLYKKFCQEAYLKTADAIVAVTGDVTKPHWREVTTHLKTGLELPYAPKTRYCAQAIHNRLQTREEQCRRWYKEHVHIYGIQELIQLATSRQERERKEIQEKLKLIRWR